MSSGREAQHTDPQNPDTTHGTAIYAAPLTPLAPPQLIGKYGSPMESLGNTFFVPRNVFQASCLSLIKSDVIMHWDQKKTHGQH